MPGVVAIVFSLALLMAIAYQGYPVVIFAPVCAGVGLALSGVPVLPGYTGPFMAGAADYVRAFFPVFLLGAIFGKLMESGGGAATIARAIAGVSLPDPIRSTKVLSIFSTSRGKRWRYPREEYPVPKSSTARERPRALSSRSLSRVASVC